MRPRYPAARMPTSRRAHLRHAEHRDATRQQFDHDEHDRDRLQGVHPDEVGHPEIPRNRAPAKYGKTRAAVGQPHGVGSGDAAEVSELSRRGRGHEKAERQTEQRQRHRRPDRQRARPVEKGRAEEHHGDHEVGDPQHGDRGGHDRPERGGEGGRDVEVTRHAGCRGSGNHGEFSSQCDRDHGARDRRRASASLELTDQPRPGDRVDHRGEGELQRFIPDIEPRHLACIRNPQHQRHEGEYGHRGGQPQQRAMPPHGTRCRGCDG